MVVRCPRCGGKRVSKNENPNNFEWICDACKREFNSDSNSSFDDFDIDSVFAEVERRKKERLEREEKGIYADESLDILGKCNAEVIRIIFDKFAIPSIGNNDDKVDYIALNFPTNDIRNAIKEAKEQIETERLERKEREKAERKERERERLERIERRKEKERKERIERERERLERERKERERLVRIERRRERLAKEKRERETKERERKERERKGIYYEKSLDLLNKCSSNVLQIVFNKFTVSIYKSKSEKLHYIALNYPTNDIERAIKEAKDQKIRERKERIEREKEERERLAKEKRERETKERERKERERKGIYYEKSLDLLNKCSSDMLQIVFNKYIAINYPINIEKDIKVKYIALNYPTNDIERAIKEANDQKIREWKERIERERKGIYYEKSLYLLRGCSAEVIRIIYNKFPLSNFKHYKSEKLDYIALNYPTKDIEKVIKEAEEQIERERNVSKDSEEEIRKERRMKNDDAAFLPIGIAGGFILTLIFICLIPYSYNYSGYLLIVYIISLVVFYIMLIIIFYTDYV